MHKISKYKINKIIQSILLTISLVIVFAFAIWWFDPIHIPHNFSGKFRFFDVILFILVSYIIWHPIIMEVLTWSVSSNIRDNPAKKPIPNRRVAFITTIVPQNEPIELLHKCLPAMVNASYPHDTWLLDEGNSQDVKNICKLYGVKHFSRQGIDNFNTKRGKYTKTKGGNHNSWYDTYGNDYDFVAQIDTDFIPHHDFLTKTLGYFRNPRVAFVGTPQVYGNANSSVVAKGASEQQYNFYGVVLRGLSGMGMTLLIGANHVIRVSAFKKVNHYTAHITEDLITGMKLHANGFKSIYVPQILALGEGPSSWEAYFSQQFRWAYGCIDILLKHTPRYLKKLGLRQSMYYLLLQQHYFTGVIMALSIILLSLYFIFGWRTASVDVFQFFTFYSVVLVLSWLMSVWLQRFNTDRHKQGELLLAGKIISIAAWPIWFLAFINVIMGKQIVYKVTPKGKLDGDIKTSNKIFLPHYAFAGIAFSGLASSTLTHRDNLIMISWAVLSAVLMLSVPISSFLARAMVKLNNYSSSVYRLFPVNRLQVKAGIQDTIFLIVVISISCLEYVSKIGFYSDDWSFLGNFILSRNQTLPGLFLTATTPNTLMRPIQNIYDAILFYFFKLNPLGYQIVNSLVFMIAVVVLYAVLRKLGIPRIISLSISLIYGLLPNYSTDRFWYAAFQVNLSLMFFLISLFCGLQAFALKTKHSNLWQLMSVVSLVLSILSYEVALPLVAVNIFLFWIYANRKKAVQSLKKFKDESPAVFIAINLIAIAYLIVFKMKTTIRLGKFNYTSAGMNLITSIFHTNFISLGAHLPYVWIKSIIQYTSLQTLVIASILYMLVFLYLYYVTSARQNPIPNSGYMLGIILAGIIVFYFGYAIFLATNEIGFSPTGIDNRVTIAAAIGVAFVFIGIVGLIARLGRSDELVRWLFCMSTTIIATGGFIVISTLAGFWTGAYYRSKTVLADIHRHFTQLPKNSTIILDGICPYNGPGIVFESQWDLKGALQTIYHDPTIRADVVTPRLEVKNNGIATEIYTFKSFYPYKNLLIYNYKTKDKYQITNKTSAIDYFKKYDPNKNNDCPPASAGNGVSIF